MNKKDMAIIIAEQGEIKYCLPSKNDILNDLKKTFDYTCLIVTQTTDCINGILCVVAYNPYSKGNINSTLSRLCNVEIRGAGAILGINAFGMIRLFSNSEYEKIKRGICNGY